VRIFKRVMGVLLLVTSLPFVGMAIHDLATGGDGKTTAGVLITIAIFFSGTAVSGIALLRSTRVRGVPELAPESLEVLALRTATSMGGTLGAAQLAAAAGVPFAQARDALEGLRRQGACQIVIESSGAELFRFPDVALGADGAARAKDMLD
jgi:hypothetical protein